MDDFLSSMHMNNDIRYIFSSQLAYLEAQLELIVGGKAIPAGTSKGQIASWLLKALSSSIQENNRSILVSALSEHCSIQPHTNGKLSAFEICDVLDEFKFRLADTLTEQEKIYFFENQFPAIDKWLMDTRKQLWEIASKHNSTDDVVQLKALESKVQTTERRLAKFQSLMHGMLSISNDFFLIILDNDAHIRNFSRGAQNIFGYEPGEVIGKTPAYLHPEWFVEQGLMDTCRRELKKHGVFDGEVTYLHKKGYEVNTVVTLKQIYSHQGSRWGTIVFGRDLSEQRKLQDQLMSYTDDLQTLVEERGRDLEESEELYRHLIEDMNAGYFISKKGRLIFTNNAFSVISGHDRDNLYGTSLLSMISSHNIEAARMWWKNVSAGFNSPPVEFVILRKNGTKAVVECKAQQLVLRGETHIIGVLHNITEKKKMEKQLRRYVDNLEKMVAERTAELENSVKELQSTQFQLVKSQKLAGIGILAAGVAHEINNPLQALLLKSQHILKHTNNEQIVNAETHDIVKYVNRMAEIVRGLSEYARTMKSDDDSTVIDIVQVVKEAIELSYHTRNFNDIRVKREFNEVGKVYANPGQLQQIFINIITNSIDAMDGKGELILRVKKKDADMVMIQVEDSGCGISEENLDKLFTPLFTTKPTGKGTGMGLHVAYRLISECGGDIQVTSELNKGTVFSILLPLSSEVNN